MINLIPDPAFLTSIEKVTFFDSLDFEIFIEAIVGYISVEKNEFVESCRCRWEIEDRLLLIDSCENDVPFRVLDLEVDKFF